MSKTVFIPRKIQNDPFTISFVMPMLQVVTLIILLLLFHYSRRYHLPPGPPGNVAGEFKNASMPEVFEKWRRKYGA